MNRIYKTVWNRLRRMYVAVNEFALSNRKRKAFAKGTTFISSKPILFKKTILSLAIASIFSFSQAENITTDTTISSYKEYTELLVSGNLNQQTINIGSIHDYGSYEIWAYDSEDAKETADIYAEQIYKSEFSHNQPTAKAATLTVNKNGQISSDKITLDKGTTEVKISYECGYAVSGGSSSDWDTATLRTSTTLEQVQYASLINDGGIVETDTLMFSASQNSFVQNSGSSNINSYFGGGLIDLNGGTTNFGTLSSGATVDSSNTVINAQNIDLTSKTFTSSNSTLKTGLDQIASFRQDITKTDALNLSGGDSKVSLNASALGRVEVVGSLLSSWVNNVTWTGGEYHFTGTYTQSAADSAEEKIHAQYGSGVKVSFDEVVADPIAADVSNGLDAATVNSIIAENSAVSSAGAIFTAFDANSVNDQLTVGKGSGDNDVKTSVGFIGLTGDDGALVTGGKTLVLLGAGGSDVISTGTVTADNGILRLGTTNTGVTVGGVVKDVDLANNGILSSYRGTYTVTDVSGNGSVDHESGTITYQNLDIAGSVTNKGTMTLGDGASWGGGSNTGRLNTQSISVANAFSNSGGTWYLDGVIGFEGSGSIANGTGTIYSKFGNFFDNGTGAEINPLNTVTLAAAAPEKVRVIETELFTQYIKGTVKEDILEHMTFDGNGVLHVTDATLTTTQRDDLTNAFKEALC